MNKMNVKADETVSQIKSLLQHLNPMIQLAGSSENTLEMLLYLAEMDPTFHKLELVKFIRKEIRTNLTSEIEAVIVTYLEEHQRKMRDGNPLDNLTQTFRHDESYLNFRSKLEYVLERGVRTISTKTAKESFSELLAQHDANSSKVSSPRNSCDNSLNSSLNQSGFLFLQPAQYNNIVENLQQKQDLDRVIESLNLLLAVTTGEPVYQDIWPTMKKCLKECLQVTHDEVFMKALRFHIRLLTSQIQVSVKEGYLNLIDAIGGFWLSKKLVGRVASKYTNFISVENDKLFQLVKILVNFMKELPMLWIRYPSNYIYEMVEATFNFYVSGKEDERMSFLDILSIVDPKATWICSWTHSQFGRRKTFEVLKNNSLMVSLSVSYCIEYLEKTHNYSVKRNKNSIQPELAYFYRFNHSLRFILTVLKYSEGRELFPVHDSTKRDHVTIKKFLILLGNVCNNSNQKMVTISILKNFVEFCHLKEHLCKILCEVGVVDVLIQVIQNQTINNNSREKVWFVKAILSFFIGVNSTACGHEFLITGKLPKVTSKTYLTSNVQTPAQVILAMTRTFLSRRSVNIQIKEISVSLSSSLLRSPLGRHLFLSHPLFNSLVNFLQEAFSIKYNDLIAVPVQAFPDTRPFCLEYKHAKAFLETLITSHKGINTLERNSVLMPVLETALPDLAKKGEISCKLLNRLVCSEQGCFSLGKFHIIKPFWDIIQLVTQAEPCAQTPLPYEQCNDSLEDALFPLICIASTLQGINLLFTEPGLQDELLYPFIDPTQQESEFYNIVLKIFGIVTSNLDGLLLMQSRFNVQETLLAHQKVNKIPNLNEIIVDENSMMRSHMLMLTFIPKGCEKYVADSFFLDEEPSYKIRPLHELPPTPIEKPIKRVIKKKSELLKFMNDTRGGLHDSAWLNHCKRAYRADLLSNEEMKTSVILEAVETVLEVLCSINEEILPGDFTPTLPPAEDIPSPISTSFNNTVFCYPPSTSQREDDGEPVTPDSASTVFDDFGPYKLSESSLNEYKTPHNSFAIDLILRYGKEQNLISDSSSQRSNLVKLKLAVDCFLVNLKSTRVDWLPFIFYFLSNGNVDRSFSMLRRLRGIKMGAVIWPALTSNLSTTHLVLPNEILYSGIIHTTKLVLFRDSPSSFLALEELGDGIMWNLLSEWINQSFIGVLPWPENLHMLLFPLINGIDYFVYALSALMIHVQKYLSKFSSKTRFRKIVMLQTTILPDWKIHEHFVLMDSLSKRFRKIVIATLTQPLNNLKYEYTIKQL